MAGWGATLAQFLRANGNSTFLLRDYTECVKQMAMAPKRINTTSIELKKPRGIELTKPIIDRAAAAAQSVVDEFSRLAVAQQILKEQGINLSLEEIVALADRPASKPVARKAAGRPKGAKKAKRAKKAVKKAVKSRRKGKKKSKRVVLTAEQKAELVKTLKGGITAGAAAKQFGVSTATVNNIKKDAGLVKPRN